MNDGFSSNDTQNMTMSEIEHFSFWFQIFCLNFHWCSRSRLNHNIRALAYIWSWLNLFVKIIRISSNSYVAASHLIHVQHAIAPNIYWNTQTPLQPYSIKSNSLLYRRIQCDSMRWNGLFSMLSNTTTPMTIIERQ